MKQVILFALIISISAFFATEGFANKSSAELDCPAVARKGSTVTIKVKFRHDGNNTFHHTKWAYIKVNGKEVGRWEWDSFKKEVKSEKGKDDYFEREVSVKVTGPLEISAEAYCNLHKSAGIQSVKIRVK